MIQAQGLTKLYGSVAAISNVDFWVERGEILGFLGPNGAGKSTTIRILTCYMPPTLGRAEVGGFDCFEQSLEVRRIIGYLPENVPLYNDMTVRRLLRFAAEAKGVPTKERSREVSRVCSTCGLEKVAHRIIANLSKGYRQRVGLAQALVGNPPVLILDEPTIGLDPKQIIEIRDLIRELGQRHTILLSSHILPEVAQVCQRVLIINEGRIIATDTPANLTSQLQKTVRVILYVRGDVERLLPELERFDGVRSVSRRSNGSHCLVVETDRSCDLRARLARAVVKQGLDLLELRTDELSLEEIFMRLVTEESPSSGEETGL